MYEFHLNEEQTAAAAAVFANGTFSEEDVTAAMEAVGVAPEGNMSRRAAREAIAEARKRGEISFDGERWNAE